MQTEMKCSSLKPSSVNKAKKGVFEKGVFVLYPCGNLTKTYRRQDDVSFKYKRRENEEIILVVFQMCSQNHVPNHAQQASVSMCRTVFICVMKHGGL